MFTMINSVRIVIENLRFHLNVKPVLYWTLYLKLLQIKLFLNFLRYVRCTKKIFCLSFVADFFLELIWFKGVLQGRNLTEVLTQLYTLPPTKQGLPRTALFHLK